MKHDDAGVLDAPPPVQRVHGPARPDGTAAPLPPERTLDPDDWESLRAVAHRMVDQMVDLHRDVRDQPTWQPMPTETRARFRGDPPPLEPSGLEATYRDFTRDVLPYRTGNIHPRWWGWVSGTGTPGGMLASMLAGGINSIAGIFDDSASEVQDQVVRWLAQALGFPEGTSGVIASGGSVANLLGLAAARDARAGALVRYGAPDGPGRPVLYASQEVHASVDKAVHLLGLGRDALRKVAVDDHYRIDVGALADAVARDRANGLWPFCIVGTAGTVNTGAVDDLEALADLAGREELWLHVDGAFGAMAALSPELRSRVRGLERADSLAFDLHKWLYVPYEAGAVLIRDQAAHLAPFRVDADYLESMERGAGARPETTKDRGLQLSRGFKALKVWMSIKEHGLRRFGEQILQNVHQADYLIGLVDRSPALELSAPTDLNVVCFRYVEGLGNPEEADAVNREILMRLHEDGIAVPSYTRLDSRFAIRVAITNHRTRREDLRLLAEEVVRLGLEVRGVHQVPTARAAESEEGSG